MTGEAVALGMAGHAALQVLPRRLAMTQQEGLLGIMVAGVQLTSSTKARLHMTVSAELAGVVTVAAVCFPRVR